MGELATMEMTSKGVALPPVGLRALSPYPEYKHSGVGWIGELPTHWSTKRLKRIVKFKGGGTRQKRKSSIGKGIFLGYPQRT